ncbi:hypothetical protein HYC85_026937 [Camellia sinensis]|uniref:Uncharacterized protein n=1 Tax=Camellia sinensis TaxID=4442 RepID=A0A7J7G8M5_CAMSI|nr:hypothetical protein HYC85_026937 [Camellia sinensis]
MKEKSGSFKVHCYFRWVCSWFKSNDNYYKLMNLEDMEMLPWSFINDIDRGLQWPIKIASFDFECPY